MPGPWLKASAVGEGKLAALEDWMGEDPAGSESFTVRMYNGKEKSKMWCYVGPNCISKALFPFHSKTDFPKQVLFDQLEHSNSFWAVTPYPSSHLCQNLGSSLESSSRFPPPLPSDCLNCWTVLYDQAWTLLAPVCFTASATQELPHLAGGESSSQLLLLPATISSVYIEAIGPLLPYDPDRCLTPHLKSKLLNMFFQALPQA
ncbi:uncharacterized protein LOC129622981 [Bubalus kerabau]|uniref:uncharacterized protein LOC129622981 n=1 Tax=Bubalus carabanensis TaxID=3119969 RepID=UPI00244E78A4|nr:uncharacterized protein LOC129622981 [Bubalus carabanensis]